MAKQPTVTFSGFDDLFVGISARFNRQMDEVFFGKNNTFIKELDKMAGKVFQAMSTGVNVQGFRAYPAMGVYHSMPSFLREFTDEEWEPLTKDYLKRKKRLMQNHTNVNKANKSSLDRVKTTAFWEYKGGLKKYFRSQSRLLTAKTNNLMTIKAPVATLGVGNHMFSDVIKKQNAGLGIYDGLRTPSEGRFDFTYDPKSQGRPITAVYSKNHPKAGTPVTSQTISSIRRSIQFDLFRGLTQHMLAIEGKAPPPSPEDYIAGIQMGSPDGKRMQQVQVKGKTMYLTGTGELLEIGAFQNTSVGNKLYYRKNGQIKYRKLITPYMRYYAKRIMAPFALKMTTNLLKG